MYTMSRSLKLDTPRSVPIHKTGLMYTMSRSLNSFVDTQPSNTTVKSSTFNLLRKYPTRKTYRCTAALRCICTSRTENYKLPCGQTTLGWGERERERKRSPYFPPAKIQTMLGRGERERERERGRSLYFSHTKLEASLRPNHARLWKEKQKEIASFSPKHL